MSTGHAIDYRAFLPLQTNFNLHAYIALPYVYTHASSRMRLQRVELYGSRVGQHVNADKAVGHITL